MAWESNANRIECNVCHQVWYEGPGGYITEKYFSEGKCTTTRISPAGKHPDNGCIWSRGEKNFEGQHFLYKLTDGQEVFCSKEMSDYEASLKNKNARQATDGNVYWAKRRKR